MNNKFIQPLFLKIYVHKILGFEAIHSKTPSKITPEYFINYMIDRKEKSEIIYNYIKIANLKENVNHKDLIRNILKNDISTKNLIDVLTIFPNEIESCINYFIYTNNLKAGCNVYSKLQLSDENILKKLEIFSKRNFANKLINDLKSEKIDLSTILDNFEDDFLFIQYFMKEFLKGKQFEECLHLFLSFDLKKFIKTFNLKEHLLLHLFIFCEDDLLIDLLNYILTTIINKRLESKNKEIEISRNKKEEEEDHVNLEYEDQLEMLMNSSPDKSKSLFLKSLLNLKKSLLERDNSIKIEIEGENFDKIVNTEKSNVVSELDYEDLNNLTVNDILKCKTNENLFKNKNISENFENLLILLKSDFGELFKLNLSENSESSDIEFFKLPIPEKNIIFIENLEKFPLVEEKLSGSKYLGIDSEWKPTSINLKSSTTSILQISDKNFSFIFDFKKLKNQNEDKFFDNFKATFKEKVFLSYAFSSDLKNFNNDNFINFFNQKGRLIDLKNIFEATSFDNKNYNLFDYPK